jgi:hypothetical protein
MAATAAPAATTMAAPAAPTARQLHAAGKVFPIEEMERGQTDVGHFLFAKNEELIAARYCQIAGYRQRTSWMRMHYSPAKDPVRRHLAPSRRRLWSCVSASKLA